MIFGFLREHFISLLSLIISAGVLWQNRHIKRHADYAKSQAEAAHQQIRNSQKIIIDERVARYCIEAIEILGKFRTFITIWEQCKNDTLVDDEYKKYISQSDILNFLLRKKLIFNESTDCFIEDEKIYEALLKLEFLENRFLNIRSSIKNVPVRYAGFDSDIELNRIEIEKIIDDYDFIEILNKEEKAIIDELKNINKF